MNFVLKNIWWIALFIFFAIMLLIISANQKDNLVTNKTLQSAKQELILTWSKAMESGSGVLTDLVKMLDDEEKIPEIKAEKKEEVVTEKVAMEEIKEEIIETEITPDDKMEWKENKQNVIQSFFWKFKRSEKDVLLSWVNDVLLENTTEKESSEMDNTEKKDKTWEMKMDEKPKVDVVISKKASTVKAAPVKKVFKKMAYKDGTFKDIPSYNGQFAVNQKPLPGVNLKTAIWNTYKLAVSGLKLNNAHFNKNLGIMKKGDVVKQMTHENKYGCFSVQVISWTIAGKHWYVCKKWFKAYQAPMKQVKHVAKNVITTKIGDVHSVSTTQLKLNNKAFNRALTTMNKGDKLEQIGNENRYGCFQARILTGAANDIGRVGYVCKKYLSGHSRAAALKSNVTALQSYAMTRATKPGDTHSVSAHSLKLNNAYFTKNLGYLSYGDTVKQLTIENTRGCFQVQVLSSRISSSTGKIGYVCKKYLK